MLDLGTRRATTFASLAVLIMMMGSTGALGTTAAGSIEELLDPAAVAASACRGKGRLASPFRQLPVLRVAVLGRTGVTIPPPLYEGTGPVTLSITTAQPIAQAYFDQGLRFAYGFNHWEAGRAFRHAQTLDSDCAMCFWGEALVLGTHVNALMAPEAHAPAVAAIMAARQRMAGTTPLERMLIEALTLRYAPLADGATAADEAAYSAAMRKAYEAFPLNDNVAVLYVESVMNLQPWDYWEAGGTRPKGDIEQAIEAVEVVLERNPDHPEAIHLYIHLTEASPAMAPRAAPHADRLGRLVPALGHLVHMPSHTYFRIGRYEDSMRANMAAVEADRAYLAQAPGSPLYAHGYYPHNIHFLMTSAQMGGVKTQVVEASQALPQAMSPELTATVAWLQPVMAAPYLAHAQFSDADIVMGLPRPSAGLPYVEAMWRYARAVGAARAGQIETAEAEIAALSALGEQADLDHLEDDGLPALDLIRLARLVARARVAQAMGDYPAAVATFREAVAIQDSLPYMEPPFWYYPVRQSLGAALLQAGDLEGAADAFEASLVDAPNNGWAYWGLLQARRMMGDEAGAKVAAEGFANAWFGEDSLLTLDRL